MGAKQGGQPARNVRAWTAEELAQLRAWAGEMPAGEIAARLGRTEDAVRVAASARGWSLRVWGMRRA
jgi:hypothetical protein